MKISKHICFFFNIHRLVYINRIIDETNIYPHKTDIFIHTDNKEFNKDILNNFTNGELSIVYHNSSGIHPYYLSWKCRPLLAEQIDKYDIFMYIEDDILVPKKAIEYWLNKNERLIELNYNLGFVRIEINNLNEEYITDLPNKKLSETIDIDGLTHVINTINPYCGFWIYNKNEFQRFIASKYYDINNIIGYDTRERSAIGLHGLQTPFYKMTVIPVVNNTLDTGCKIYHMPNNYINHYQFAKIRFQDAIECANNVSNNSNKDYMNPAHVHNINFNYDSLCYNRWNNATDIYQHLPTLYNYAKECESVFETGVRGCISSWAFTKGLLENNKPVKSLFLNDISPCKIDELLRVTADLPIKVQYKWINNLQLDLPSKVDLTFIDTWHVYGQLKRELVKFSKLTKKYIIMHDTTVDGIQGESMRLNSDMITQSKESGFPVEEINCGLQKAIDEFLQTNKDWTLHKVYTNNNGLTILKRKGV